MDAFNMCHSCVIKDLMVDYSVQLQTAVQNYQTAEKEHTATGLTSTERQTVERKMRKYKKEEMSHMDMLDTLRTSHVHVLRCGTINASASTSTSTST
jgi:hypothetical protein